MLSQLSRYGTVHKLRVDDLQMAVTTRFHIEGSVLADTLRSWPLEFDTRLEIQSPEPPARIARMVYTAEQSCYVLQSLRQPVHVNRAVTLNGETLRPGVNSDG